MARSADLVDFEGAGGRGGRLAGDVVCVQILGLGAQAVFGFG